MTQVTFGKFGWNHPVRHSLSVPTVVVDPFGLYNYADAHFACTQYDMSCADAGWLEAQ